MEISLSKITKFINFILSIVLILYSVLFLVTLADFDALLFIMCCYYVLFGLLMFLSMFALQCMK